METTHDTQTDETGRAYLARWEQMGEDAPAPLVLAIASQALVELAESCEAGEWNPSDEEHLASLWLLDAIHHATLRICKECGYDPNETL